jgi:hypothetical protein
MDIENEARQKAEDKAKGTTRYRISPEAIKRRLAAKKAAQRAEKQSKSDG